MTSYNRSGALVVDDDVAHVESMSAILEEEGLRVTHVNTGRRARSLLRERSFGMMVVDEHLPDADGLELAAFARRISPQTTVILTTSRHSMTTERAAQVQGISEYLTKPLNENRLQLRLRRLLMHSMPPPMPAKRPSRPPPVEDERDDAPAEGSLSRTRVVVVEPDDELRMSLMEVVAQLGCQVSAFSSAARAEAQVKKVGFDLILADPGIVSSGTRWVTRHKRQGKSGVLALMEQVTSPGPSNEIKLSTKGVVMPPFEKWLLKSDLASILRNYAMSLQRRSDQGG